MTRKKLIAVLGAAVLVVALASAAFAYWTTTGSGSTSASVALSNGTLTLNATVAPGIYPGGSSNVTFSADNANATDLHIGTLHLAGVTADNLHSTCDTTDFSLADVIENQTIAGNTTGTALGADGTLVYANSAVDQGACKGATLTLDLTSN
jgi:hypothetical protein